MYRHQILPSTVQMLSLCAIPLELMCGEMILGRATGFVDIVDGRHYLVTNWHNVTGRIPFNGRTRASDGITPDAVRVYHHRETTTEIAPRRFVVGVDFNNSDPTTYPIEFNHQYSWFMHPSGQSVDIALLEIEPRGLHLNPISYVVNQFETQLSITQDVFVLGFPMGLQPTGNIPIWKRGSIATEPAVNAQGEPCFWIDAATRPGMSGSPVFVRSTVKHDSANRARSSPTTGMLESEMGEFAFIGIYSGRMGNSDALDSQLGKVWRPINIEEAIRCRNPLSFEERR